MHICSLQGLLSVLLSLLLVQKGHGTNGAAGLANHPEGASKLFAESFLMTRDVVLTKQPIFPGLTPSLSALPCRSVG